MRLSQVFSRFVGAVVALGASFAHDAADAVEASFLEPSAKDAAREREIKGGRVLTVKPVDRGALETNLTNVLREAGFRDEVRELRKAIDEDCQDRGRTWVEFCLRDALVEHLVNPLRAGAAQAVAPPPPAPVKAPKSARARS